MRKSALIQIAIALLLSLTAGVLIFRWMNDRTQVARQEVRTVEQHMVAVAAEDLVRGMELKEEHLKLTPFLKESIPAGAFNSAERLVGRMLGSDVSTGEPVTEARLLSEAAAAGGVSTLIEPGKRAVAVKGNKVMGLSGFVRPGNRVDVVVTVDIDDDGKEYSFTKTVLEDIKVLATGTQLEVTGDDGETASVDVYTLEMNSKESEKLAFAATKGTLHFALRNPDEAVEVKTPGVSVKELVESLQSRSLGGGRKKPRPTANVELITGTDRQVMRFQHAPAN